MDSTPGERGPKMRTSLGEKIRELRERFTEDLESAGILEGDPRTVFEAVSTHAQHQREGVSDTIRPAIFYLGGGSRGTDGIGVAMALQHKHLLEGFRAIFGVSTGAHIATAHATHQTERGSQSYRSVVGGKDFVNVSRGARGLIVDPLVRALGFETAFRPLVDIEKPLRVYAGSEAVPKGRGPFRSTWNQEKHRLIFQVTDKLTGEPILVYPSPGEDVLKKIGASSALPKPFYGDATVDGRTVTDGSIADPMPLKLVIEDLEQKAEKPTHIVIVANRRRHQYAEKSLGRKLADRVIKMGFSQRLKEVYDKNEDTFEANLRYLSESGIPYVVIWTDSTIKTLETDSTRIKNTTLTSFLRTCNTLDTYLPGNP